ncbi:MAG: fibronectin type III domain-containing protein [Candidatus Paceibacterota bacterium]|jgi:hypothetical protein
MKIKDNFQKKSIAILLLVVFYFLFNLNFLNAQSNSIQIDLGVDNCNNNGICEGGENSLSCPVDCPVVVPPIIPGTRQSGPPLITINNLKIEPNFTSAMVYWTSSVSTISTIRWGESSEVGEGALKSIIYAQNHKMEIINLRPGTMYYFTIESQDVGKRTHLTAPFYFFTKSYKDTTFPLNPRNVRTRADITGITITWENPPDPDFSYIRIMRHEDRFRGSPFLGKLIYEGDGTSFLDADVIPGKKYFYSLFARNNKGEFSSGVAVSQVAFSEKKLPTTPPPKDGTGTGVITEPVITTPEALPTFFVYQYNQIAQILSLGKIINIAGDKDTIIDTYTKTLPDDYLWVKNNQEEVVGTYLFSYNKDSGRYQAVIPPLQQAGEYTVKTYRYRDGNFTTIAEGILQVQAEILPKTVSKRQPTCLCCPMIYVLALIWLFLLLLFLKKTSKEAQK